LAAPPRFELLSRRRAPHRVAGLNPDTERSAHHTPPGWWSCLHRQAQNPRGNRGESTTGNLQVRTFGGGKKAVRNHSRHPFRRSLSFSTHHPPHPLLFVFFFLFFFFVFLGGGGVERDLLRNVLDIISAPLFPVQCGVGGGSPPPPHSGEGLFCFFCFFVPVVGDSRLPGAVAGC